MKLRIARHTTNLEKIVAFYRDVLGLEELGGFKDHQNYDGVFLGFKGESWHLEFTVSDEVPDHKPDEDDLLVLYADTEEDQDSLIHNIKEAGINPVPAKNPYWEENGVTILDLDGYRVVISINK